MLERRVSEEGCGSLGNLMRHLPVPLTAHIIQPFVSLSRSFAPMVLGFERVLRNQL